MNKALITVQAGQLSKQKIAQLNLMLKQHYRRFVCDTKLQTVWCVVPTGQAFTKYELSRSSLLTIECPNGFEQRKRISMLKACERDWVAITGQHSDDLMLALVDEEVFKTVLQSNQNRLSTFGKLHMGFHLAAAILRSLVARTPTTFNPNL